MNAKRVVALLVAALAVYFVLIGYRAVYLLGQHRWALKGLGAAVLLLPLIGIYVVVVELRFGLATQRLGERLASGSLTASGGPDSDDLAPARTAAGRVDRDAADAAFERRRAEVEADPDDWRGWYRLALAYDDAGDRKRARAAMRTAIARAD